jgi:hypothetical protein
MKTSYVIIASLGLNAILVVGVVHKRTAARELAPEAGSVLPVASAKVGVAKKAAPEISAPVIVDVPGEPFSWVRVEAADYHKYVKNLRSIGCPEETVQDIIYSDVTKLYAEKFRALNRQYRYGPSGAQEYWNVSETYSYNAERNRKYRELTEEKKALLIELLGVDLEKLRRERMGYPDYEALRTAYLPEDKRKQVEDIRQRFQDMEQAVYQKYKEYYGEEQRAEMETIKKQREAELAKILTPAELEEYKLRNSQVAQQMKWSLQAFEPSEQEFRTLFKVEDQFADTMGHFRFGGPDPDDPAEQKQWSDANKLKDEEYKKLLGEDRYKEYTRAKDYQYQELYRLAQRSGLPKETASKVYDMKEAIEKQANQVKSDQTLSAEQKQQTLTEMRTLAEKTLQETLGEKNFKSYQSRGGYWMRNLAPTPRTTPRR